MESLILPLMLALMAGFMFFSIRNQKKRAAAQSEMQNSLTAGARVQLHSGLFATVVDADQGDVVTLEVAPGVVTEWNRLAIREVVAPDTGDAEEFTSLDESADDTVSLDKEQNEEK
ncbi:MAG: preprotein translocase subunit YajC [Gordonia sp. (in: high G+C Gram-positive bacteria)]|uniref:preprotein translocase subunit YajC n=1 Tax=Gordonia TaxID=2053 RepID=UPI003264D330